MPEIQFKIQWPDGSQELCYSPSLVVKEYLTVGEQYSLEDFAARTREALTIASDRVQKKYGFPCSRALGQLQRIAAKVQVYQAQVYQAQADQTGQEPPHYVQMLEFLP